LSKLIRTDFHIHSFLSDCAAPTATLEAVVAAGREAELEAIGISDHVFFGRHRGRPAIARRALPREVDGMSVCVGCEADMQAPDRVAIDAEFAAGLDYVMVSASHLYDPGVEQEFIDEPRSMVAYMLDLMRGAINLGYVDIIVHPLHVPACRYSFADFAKAADEANLRSVARMAAEAGVAMECNPRFLRAAPEEAKRLFSAFLEEDCILSINSDAHRPSSIGCRGPGFATEEALRALGIDEDRLFQIGETATRALRSR
jgi:histidinol phosphatase-like PHP family hydrolase